LFIHDKTETEGS